MENPWPDLTAELHDKPKRAAFPRAQSQKSSGGRARKQDQNQQSVQGVSSGSVQLIKGVDIDMTPPSPVLEPNETAHHDHISSLQADIDRMENRVVQINEEFEKAKLSRSAHEFGIKKMKTDLSYLRQQISQVSKERDELSEKFRRVGDGLKAQELKLDKIRKDLQFVSEEAVDDKVREISQRLETSSLDLKTEKELIEEIQRLSIVKISVGECCEGMKIIAAKREGLSETLQSRQSKSDELAVLREKEKSLASKFEFGRPTENSIDGMKVSSFITGLMDEKSALISSLKAKRAEFQNAVIAFKIKIAEYREYKQAVAAFEKKMERLQQQQRRAEAAAKAENIKEERRRQEAERKEDRRRQEQRMAAVAGGVQLFVAGLAPRCEEVALRALFERFGTVSDAYVARDPAAGLCRGFGFVTFADRACAEAAVRTCNGAEARDLCAASGRLSVRPAEKSKAQLDFEARRAARPGSSSASGRSDGASEGAGSPPPAPGLSGPGEAAVAAPEGGAADVEATQPPPAGEARLPEARPARAAHKDAPPPPPPPVPAAAVRTWPAPAACIPAPPPASPAAAPATTARRPPPASGGGTPRGEAAAASCGRREGRAYRDARDRLPAAGAA